MRIQNKRQKKGNFFICNFFPKNRKGISNVIGYVLLIVITIVISTIVFQWMKTYIPTDPLDCPDGVSVFVKDYDYNCTENQLNLKIKNNGRFNIGGYFIHGTNSPEQKLAIIDLTPYADLGTGGDSELAGLVIFNTENNSFNPNNEIKNLFDFSDTSFGQIYSIEIIPIRYQLTNNKNRIVSCSNAKIKQKVFCGVGEVVCIPENISITCDSWVCGSKINNCGNTVSCQPGCNSGFSCDASGQCIDNSCTPATDPSLIGICGIQNCGTATNGTCGQVSC